MNTQKLLVHDSGKRKCAERLHTSIIYSVGVLVLALQLEGEVIGQMPAFMVASKQEQCVWVPNLE